MEEIRFKLSIKRIWALLLILLIVNIYVEGSNDQIDHDSKKFTSAEYQEYINNVNNNARKMSVLSVMSEGYAIENIKKTLQDFSDISISWNDDSNTVAVQELLDSKMLDIEILCFVLLMVVFITEEKRNGLWYLKHSYLSGRGRSAINTIIAVGLWCLFGVFIFMSETLIVTCIKNNSTDLLLPIQAVGGHHTVVQNISILSYLGQVLFVKAIGYFALAMFLMSCLYLVRRELIAIIGVLAIIGISRHLYLEISLQGQWSLLKAVNPWMLICRDDLLRMYNNLNLFDHAVSMKPIVLVLAVMADIFLGFFYYLILIKMYPNDAKTGILSQRIKQLISKGLFAGGFRRLEHYKILTVRTGQIGIVLFIVFLAQNNLIGRLSFGDNQQYKNELYQMIEPLDISSGLKKLEEEHNKNNELINEYAEARKLLEMSSMEWQAFADAINELEKKNDIVYELILYSKKLVEKQNEGIDVIPINDIGYRFMFTSSGMNMQYKLSFVLLIFIIIIVAPGMAQERNKRMDKLIHASSPNDIKLYFSKVKAYYAWIAVASLICSMYELFLIKDTYGLGDIGKSIQSLSVFQQTSLDMKIISILILDIVVQIIICIIVASIIFVFSMLFNNTVAAILVTFIIFAIPSWARMLGVNINDVFCLINYLCSYQRVKLCF